MAEIQVLAVTRRPPVLSVCLVRLARHPLLPSDRHQVEAEAVVFLLTRA